MTKIEKYLYKCKRKLQYLGYGEWIEEPDEVIFPYKNTLCKISRFIIEVEPSLGGMFGGHLCGYVKVPKNHLWYEKPYNEIECFIHGGLTVSKQGTNTHYWVGFDCAHPGDLVPSLKKIFQKMFANSVYRNIDYVMQECKNLVDQMENIELKVK